MALTAHECGAAEALSALADALGAKKEAAPAPAETPAAPSGKLNAFFVGASLARHMPAQTIVADDGVTGSNLVMGPTQGAQPHDWLYLTGGAIGMGLPLAIGAAVAAPDRKVVCLSGDGAGMYTSQALWTMAREQMDILTIVFANKSYRILNIELQRTGAGEPGPTAQSMLSLDNPAVDWVKLAESQGVHAVRCETAEAFEAALPGLLARKGPKLVEAVV